MRASRYLPLIGFIGLCIAPAAHAQQPPAIHGFNGTIATDATIKDEHKAANKVASEVASVGSHEAKGPLADLRLGATVVVHYNVDKVTEGTVSKISWSSNEITVRYDTKTSEKLQLADGVPLDANRVLKAAPDGSTKIVVYSDATGQKIARYFKPKKS